ncbi:MAG: 30S ribosomal protein S4 [Candidatus Melainabacteria bacterium]|nr:MAG: 30S ribosomal protein S4 [Candidatus Melainabacteria bacterium]
MMRYLDSKAKRCRAVGVNLYGNAKFDRLLARGANPPGEHGNKKHKLSDYGEHLKEKQKIRWTYGASEKQFVRAYEEASRAKAATGTVLLQLLERRLDNVVYRSGLFASRDQARQIVSHGHVLVNGTRLNVASARLNPGDEITFKEKSHSLIKSFSESNQSIVPQWLEVNKTPLRIKFLAVPEREDLDQTFRENLVVEYYSR